jgi:hypothetical protein
MSDSQPRPQFSPSTMRLSERYGIDPARLDAMLGKPKDAQAADASVASPATDPSRDWIESRRMSTAAPVAGSTAAATTPIMTPAATTSNVEVPKDVRSVGSTLSGGSSTVYRSDRTDTSNRTSPTTWVLAAAVIGLLAYLLAMRGCEREKAQQTPTLAPTTIDTMIARDTVSQIDTVVRTVPVPTPDVADSRPAARPRATRRASTSSASSRNVALSTTSSFSAKEKLAELKADGNSRAYIQPVKRNGVTVYQVKTRR